MERGHSAVTAERVGPSAVTPRDRWAYLARPSPRLVRYSHAQVVGPGGEGDGLAGNREMVSG